MNADRGHADCRLSAADIQFKIAGRRGGAHIYTNIVQPPLAVMARLEKRQTPPAECVTCQLNTLQKCNRVKRLNAVQEHAVGEIAIKVRKKGGASELRLGYSGLANVCTFQARHGHRLARRALYRVKKVPGGKKNKNKTNRRPPHPGHR